MVIIDRFAWIAFFYNIRRVSLFIACFTLCINSIAKDLKHLALLFMLIDRSYYYPLYGNVSLYCDLLEDLCLSYSLVYWIL